MAPNRLRRLRRRRAIGNLSLVVSTLIVAPFFFSAQKQVVLIVEGQQRQVTTFSDDVGDLLSSTGLTFPDDALVVPSPTEELDDGMVVLVDLFLMPGAPGTAAATVDSATERASVFDLLEARAREEARQLRLSKIQAKRAARVEAARAARIAERKAAEEAARKAAEEAARKAAEEKAAQQRASSTIEGCNQDWRTKAGAEALIRCAVERWAVPGGAEKAIAVARCESGLWYLSGKGSAHLGIYQHSAYYWPDRAAAYGFAGFDALNGRANIMVAIQYAHDHGWGAWSGCA